MSRASALQSRTDFAYDELRQVAHGLLARGSSLTLTATGLVHEAFIRLAQSDRADWNDHQHYISACAQAMRHVLVDRVRRKLAAVHGGQMRRRPLTDAVLGHFDGERLMALSDALEALKRVDSRQAEIVDLRFFAGFSHLEIANLMEISRSTVQVEWRMAKAWLCRELDDER
ncbi:ECF-type sigma factor [Novipirellula artificiosorum]|uniref:RNA polymerase sigma factor n=1 Tax=Novipirellula artificiosorum TaxID=2528016 RepID=A0A5C6DM71_9BACT|nr:ECF-type sigma factor [Novipirellula artificiosorum]TWU37234.1 RNA polymerase sigma factor [Novipirellula artificiosorum]